MRHTSSTSTAPGVVRVVLACALAVTITAATGCAASRGPSAPIALEQVAATTAQIAAQTRAAARVFVIAYADAAADDGLALSRKVGGREMAEWVRWLSVQNAQFDGAVRGHADLATVTFSSVEDRDGLRLATVELRASVTFEYEPVDDDAFSVTRSLDGPMTLALDPGAGWLVVDATRDGSLMSDRIAILDGVRATAGGVTVTVASTFAFAPNVHFNVSIANRSGAAVEADIEASGIGTDTDRFPTVITSGLRSISSGSEGVGIIAAALDAVVDGDGDLVLVLRVEGQPTTFRFSVAELLGRTAAGGEPTADATPSVSPTTT